MNKYHQLRKKFRLEMPRLAPQERISGFTKYCQAVVDAKEKNEITIEEASELIFLGHFYDEDLTAYFKSSPDVFVTDEILEIASNMDTLPGYYPEGRNVGDDWERITKLVGTKN